MHLIRDESLGTATPLNLENSPILVLEANILWQFENLRNGSRDRLTEDVASGRLLREIALQIDAAVPRGPFVQVNRDGVPEVHLQVAFLELLWAFIYSWMILYEEGVQRPQLPGTELPTGPVPRDLLDRADALKSWCQSLAHGYSPWPVHLPSPKNYTNSAEKYFGEKANHVFQHAVAFLLNHERAHAVFEHLPVVATQLNNSELKLQLEKEADVYAFTGLVPHGLSDKEKALESWAVLAVALATFYVYVEPLRALVSTTHPSLHHRIGSLVQSLAWEGDEYRYYFPFLCRLVLQDLFPDVLTPRVQFENAEEALTDALDALDEYVRA